MAVTPDGRHAVTGYRVDELVGHSPRILQGPRSSREVLDRIGTRLRAWQPVREEILNYTKDGREIWLELDIVPVADATGWFTHWIAIERNVTERKRAEDLSRISEERFRLLVDGVRDYALYMLEVDGRVATWNAGAERIKTLHGSAIASANSR